MKRAFSEIPEESKIPFIPIQWEVYENKERPKVLYHGSETEVEDELHPAAEHHRDVEEGSVVFGTPDAAFATMFMSPRPDDSWTERGRYNGVYYFACDDESRFLKGDNGGFIFALSPDNFDCDEKKSMGRCEWIARESVEPIGKRSYPSTLEAMIENGVQVYFIDRETLDRMKSAEDHGMGILKDLQSENQKRGQNTMNMFEGAERKIDK